LKPQEKVCPEPQEKVCPEPKETVCLALKEPRNHMEFESTTPIEDTPLRG
jgi:hypothetical protein